MKTKTKFSHWSLKIILGFMCAMALGSKSNAQVLITWDSTLNTGGAVLTGNSISGYQFASTGIEWEVGLWSNSVTTTDKASILSSFTSFKGENAALYSGVIGADGQFTGSNVEAVIPAAWVGTPGTSFGIVFGRSSEDTWGAFRFSNYGGGNFAANIPPPTAAAQQSPFALDQIGVAYVPADFTDSYVLSGLAIDVPSFGDTDPAPGNQYFQATNGIVLIPEPSSASLLALGVAGLVALRARRKS